VSIDRKAAVIKLDEKSTKLLRDTASRFEHQVPEDTDRFLLRGCR